MLTSLSNQGLVTAVTVGRDVEHVSVVKRARTPHSEAKERRICAFDVCELLREAWSI